MHLALAGLGIGPEDEVITTPITWPATANVVVHLGGRPVFVDVREADLNIEPELVAAAVTPRTKAILPVDLAGQPCDLDPLLDLGLPVVEDAAHAIEAEYRGRKVGSIAHATCFSLYATKNVAAGEVVPSPTTTSLREPSASFASCAAAAPSTTSASRTEAISQTFSLRSPSASWTRSTGTRRSAGATSRPTTRP